MAEDGDRVDRAYVEANKNTTNFYHSGRKVYIQGLPPTGATFRTAVYGPDAVAWKAANTRAQQEARRASSRATNARNTSISSVSMPVGAPTSTTAQLHDHAGDDAAPGISSSISSLTSTTSNEELESVKLEEATLYGDSTQQLPYSPTTILDSNVRATRFAASTNSGPPNAAQSMASVAAATSSLHRVSSTTTGFALSPVSPTRSAHDSAPDGIRPRSTRRRDQAADRGTKIYYGRPTLTKKTPESRELMPRPDPRHTGRTHFAKEPNDTMEQFDNYNKPAGESPETDPSDDLPIAANAGYAVPNVALNVPECSTPARLLVAGPPTQVPGNTVGEERQAQRRVGRALDAFLAKEGLNLSDDEVADEEVDLDDSRVESDAEESQ